jgi:hypothetical protein
VGDFRPRRHVLRFRNPGTQTTQNHADRSTKVVRFDAFFMRSSTRSCNYPRRIANASARRTQVYRIEPSCGHRIGWRRATVLPCRRLVKERKHLCRSVLLVPCDPFKYTSYCNKIGAYLKRQGHREARRTWRSSVGSPVCALGIFRYDGNCRQCGVQIILFVNGPVCRNCDQETNTDKTQ